MHRSIRYFAFLAAALSCWLGSPCVHAQSNAAIAQQLFLDGQKLMDAGSLPEACAKFADSQRLDPAIGTLMHLAGCHEKMGKFASAWSEFTDVATQAHKGVQPERERYARDHAAALAGKVPKIMIELAHPPDGTTITLDGAPLPLGVLGTEIPLDQGDHSLEVAAPGMKHWRQAKLNLGPSAVVTRVQVMLEEEPPQPAKSHAEGVDGNPQAAIVREQAPESHNMTRRVVGFSVGGLGLASLAVAIVEEVTSVGRSSDESKYPATDVTDRQTVADQSSTARTYAIVFGAVGVAAVGTGAYLVLTSREATRDVAGTFSVRPLVGGGVAGASLHLDW
jgi:hypothetical protein